MSDAPCHPTSLLGKRVRVTLASPLADHLHEDDGTVEGCPGCFCEPNTSVIAEGLLLGFGDDGTVEIEEDDGFVHYCWPMLEIEETP